MLVGVCVPERLALRAKERRAVRRRTRLRANSVLGRLEMLGHRDVLGLWLGERELRHAAGMQCANVQDVRGLRMRRVRATANDRWQSVRRVPSTSRDLCEHGPGPTARIVAVSRPEVSDAATKWPVTPLSVASVDEFRAGHGQFGNSFAKSVVRILGPYPERAGWRVVSVGATGERRDDATGAVNSRCVTPTCRRRRFVARMARHVVATLSRGLASRASRRIATRSERWLATCTCGLDDLRSRCPD